MDRSCDGWRLLKFRSTPGMSGTLMLHFWSMPTPSFILKLREKIGNDLLLLPGVTGVVLNDAGEILLMQRKDTLQWMPIGGCVEPDEEPSDCILRETFEETAVRAEIVALVNVDAMGKVTYPNGDRVNFVTTTYLLRAFSGEPKPNDDEAADARFFPIDQMPRLKKHHQQRVDWALAQKTRNG
jgi:ADP-ribose pyrophosphatase YjhB (NUDIX family)